MRNEEVLHRVTEERNVLFAVKSRKANWTGYVLRRNCLLKDVNERKIKGWIKVTGRRGGRRTELQDCLRRLKGTGNCKRRQSFALCGELALGESVNWLWERLCTSFGRGCGLTLGEAVNWLWERV